MPGGGRLPAGGSTETALECAPAVISGSRSAPPSLPCPLVLARVHDEGEVVGAFGRQDIELHVFEAVDAVDHQESNENVNG